MITKLNSITTGFKRFKKNQFLTEAHLNQVVDHFDDQIRLSRTCLSGVGIVCGFEVSCNSAQTQIKISQGLGISTDGDLFHVYKSILGTDDKQIDFSEIAYTAYKAYDNKEAQYTPYFYEGNTQHADLYELLPALGNSETSPLRSGFPSGLAIKDAVVLLYLDTYEKDAAICSSMSCDSDGNEIISNYRVLITSKATAMKINAHDALIQRTNFGHLYEQLPEVIMPRIITKPEDLESYEALQASFAVPLEEKKIHEKLETGFIALYTQLEAPDMLAAVANKLNMIFDFGVVDVPTDFQYRYDLLKDIVATYNDIKATLSHMSASDCCPDVNSFPKHLMLGEVVKSGNCFEYRHGFYQSILHSNQILDACGNCLPSPVAVPFSPGAVTTFCEEDLDEDSDRSNHIVFAIDESGSFRSQIEFVKTALNAYIASVADSDTYISIIGMSGNIENTRNDHVLYKLANDVSIQQWINEVYGTASSGGSNGADYWGSAYQVILDEIINAEVPNPSIVITLGDEGPGPYNDIGHVVTLERANLIKQETKLFTYVVDNYRRDSVLSGFAIPALGPGVIPSVDGASDLGDTDYFLASDFSDLEIKIRNLNDALINSNILCIVDTLDEVLVDPDGQELHDCYLSVHDDENRLYSLAKKAVLQLTNYNAEYQLVKVTPSRSLGKLAKKAIPFYYNVGEELIAAWDFDKTVIGRHKMNLSYHNNKLAIKKPLELCLDNNFYRIEGHQGRDYREVVDRLRVIKQEYNLDFNIVVLGISSNNVLDSSVKPGTEAVFTELLSEEAYTKQYLAKSTGFEHIAGVAPKGTFVIVYLKDELVIKDEVSKPKESSSITKQFVANAVIADFALPHLCCEEGYISLSLPKKVLCIDESTESMPFNINPKDGIVKASVSPGLNGGVVRGTDGLYSFDPQLVSKELYGQQIPFEVNNQATGFSITVYVEPKLEVTSTIQYNKLKTEATVAYKLTGDNLQELEYSWDFGDLNSSNDKPDSDGLVKKVYSLPVNSANTINPTLRVSVDDGACPVSVPLDAITFDDPIVISFTLDINDICMQNGEYPDILVGYTTAPIGEVPKLKKEIDGVSVTPTAVVFSHGSFEAFDTPIEFTVLGEDVPATITVHQKPILRIDVDPTKIIYDTEKTTAKVFFEVSGEGLPSSPSFKWSLGDGTYIESTGLTLEHTYTDLSVLTDRTATVIATFSHPICGDSKNDFTIVFEQPPVKVVFDIPPAMCIPITRTASVGVNYTITPPGTLLESSKSIPGMVIAEDRLVLDATFKTYDEPISFKALGRALGKKITLFRKPEFEVTFDREGIIYSDSDAIVTYTIIATHIPVGAILKWDFGDETPSVSNTTLVQEHAYNMDELISDSVRVVVTILDEVCGETISILEALIKEEKVVPVTFEIAETEICLDTAACYKPVHIGIARDNSDAIDETEITQIKEALSTFVNSQKDGEKILSLSDMSTTDNAFLISSRGNNLPFERYVSEVIRGLFSNAVQGYPTINASGKPYEGDYWASSLGAFTPGYTDVVVVIAKGLQTNDFDGLRTMIKTLNDQGTHIFYFTIGDGDYVIEGPDGSGIPVLSEAGNLVTTLTQLLGRPPVLAKSDFTDFMTADYYAPNDFSELSNLLSQLDTMVAKERDCSGSKKSIVTTVIPEDAIVTVAATDSSGIQVESNTVVIDPKEFKAFDKLFEFNVNGTRVPETLIVHEFPGFDFEFVTIKQYDSDQSAIPVGAVITEGNIIGGGLGSYFQSVVVVCNALNLNDFNESEYRFEWDFGDGTISKERNPVHRYRYNSRTNILIKLSVVGGFCNTETVKSFSVFVDS